MRARCTLFYLLLIAWPDEINNDLSDADHIICFQDTFARYPFMIDECAIGAVQIHNRNLFLCFIGPNFGVVTRRSRILQDNVIRDSAAERCLSASYFKRLGKTVWNMNDEIPHT